ncbi:MAG TPA: cupin domain-containing protein [Opitutaceae bacterium]
MNEEARQLAARLRLAPLPGEGGLFAASWTGRTHGPDGRALASGILFMIAGDDFSALHRLQMDEAWHHQAGDPAELVLLGEAGGARRVVLGPDPLSGHAPQAFVRAGLWQGARLLPGPRGWALFGCVVTPAWEARGFELGATPSLLRDFPGDAGIIRSLTR